MDVAFKIGTTHVWYRQGDILPCLEKSLGSFIQKHWVRHYPKSVRQSFQKIFTRLAISSLYIPEICPIPQDECTVYSPYQSTKKKEINHIGKYSSPVDRLGYIHYIRSLSRSSFSSVIADNGCDNTTRLRYGLEELFYKYGVDFYIAGRQVHSFC